MSQSDSGRRYLDKWPMNKPAMVGNYWGAQLLVRSPKKPVENHKPWQNEA